MSRLDSVEVSGLLIAQESVTSTTVKWFIVALLVVAALLTMLTVWYWRHTDPRQRMAANRRAPVDRAPAPRPAPLAEQPLTGQSLSGQALTGQAAPRQPAPSHDGWAHTQVPSASDAANEARRLAQTGGGANASQAMSSPTSAAEDLEADDWLRLTGPQALPRDGV